MLRRQSGDTTAYKEGNMPAGWHLALARLLFAQLFFVSAWNKAFVDPFARLSGRLAQKGFPLAEIVGGATIAFEFAVATLMLIGLWTRWAAWGMLGFCLIAGLLFHNFWAFPPEQMYGQTTQLLKNFVIIGGLIYVVQFGPGPWSVDERRRADVPMGAATAAKKA
jgi:putative oxidoreductase